jgi:predicted transcriptional regulator
MRAGKVRFAILLSKWINHSAQEFLRKNHVDFMIWGRGLPELILALPEIARAKGVFPKSAAISVETPVPFEVVAPIEVPPVEVPMPPEIITPTENAPSGMPTASPESLPVSEPTPQCKGRRPVWTEQEDAALLLVHDKGGVETERQRDFYELVPDAEKRSLSSLRHRLRTLLAKSQPVEHPSAELLADTESTSARILAHLLDKKRAVTVSQLDQALKTSTKGVIKRLLREELISHKGQGVRTSAYKYLLTEAGKQAASGRVEEVPKTTTARTETQPRQDDYLVFYIDEKSRKQIDTFPTEEEALNALTEARSTGHTNAELWIRVKVRAVTKLEVVRS